MRRGAFYVFLSLVFGIVAGGGLRPPDYTFEVDLDSSVAGEAKIYFDRGQGLSEEDTAAQQVAIGPNRLHLPLPIGEIRRLRFDPIAGEGEITVGEARITLPSGWTLKRFPPATLIPIHDLREIALTDEHRELVTTVGANDPQLNVTLSAPLRLPSSFVAQLIAARWTVLAWWSGSLAVLAVILLVLRHRDRWWLPLRQVLQAHPQLTLACCGALAGMAASYPVAFFGQSFTAPSSGIRLLYDGTITVPKQTDVRLADARGADIGAFHWAHQPYTVVERHALQEGHLPLWNRYNSCGVTLVGQGQSMFGDPLNFLVMLAGADALAFDAKFVLCKALFAFGVGLAVWLLTRDLPVAALSTFGAAFIAFFNYRVNHPAIFSMSYSPWILVGWLKLLGATNGRRLSMAVALWFLANWALLTSGTAKEAYLLCAALNGTGGLMLLLGPVPISVKIRRAIPIALAGIAFILASAPLWWTFLDALGRAATFYDVPHAFQGPRTWMIGLFDDAFYQESLPAHALYNPGANFLILLGCAWAIVSFRRMWQDRFALALWIGLLAAISVAFAWMPAAWILATPLLRNVHHVGNHFSCIAIVHAAILAGWGFAAARRSFAAGRVMPHILGAALLVGVLLVAYFTENPAIWTANRGFAGWRELRAEHEFLYGYVLVLLVAGTTFGWIAVRCFRGRPLTGLTGVIGALALVGLLGRHAAHLPLAPPSPFIYTPGTRCELFTPSPSTELLQQVTASDPARVVGTVNALFTGYMSVHGLESHTGPDALFSPYYREFLLSAELVPAYDWRSVFVPPSLASWRPFLDFLNVRYIAATPNTVPDGSHFRRIARLDLDILRGETTWPRAFYTDRLEHYQEIGEFVARLRRQPAGQPFAAVHTGDPDLPPPVPGLVGTAVTRPASAYELSANATAFTVVAPRPGFAILHETWMKDDFRVTANGKPVPYFRVNHTFKGIALPAPGTYRIKFEYWPRHFTGSLVLGGTGFLAIAILLMTIFRRVSMPPVLPPVPDRLAS